MSVTRSAASADASAVSGSEFAGNGTGSSVSVAEPLGTGTADSVTSGVVDGAVACGDSTGGDPSPQPTRAHASEVTANPTASQVGRERVRTVVLRRGIIRSTVDVVAARSPMTPGVSGRDGQRWGPATRRASSGPSIQRINRVTVPPETRAAPRPTGPGCRTPSCSHAHSGSDATAARANPV